MTRLQRLSQYKAFRYAAYAMAFFLWLPLALRVAHRSFVVEWFGFRLSLKTAEVAWAARKLANDNQAALEVIQAAKERTWASRNVMDATPREATFRIKGNDKT